MTTDPNITTLRRLLKSYYEAAISEAELKELLHLLSSTENIPADMIPDRDMILALHSLPGHDEARETSRQRVYEALSTVPRRRIPGWKITAAAVGIAACLAIAVTVAYRGIYNSPSLPVKTHTDRFTAAAKANDSIPQKIIRLAADTIGLRPSPISENPATKTAIKSRNLAKTYYTSIEETPADSLRMKRLIRKMDDIDAETIELIADLKTTLQDDYAVAIQMMEEINESYSSTLLFPDTYIPRENNNIYNNKPLLSI